MEVPMNMEKANHYQQMPVQQQQPPPQIVQQQQQPHPPPSMSVPPQPQEDKPSIVTALANDPMNVSPLSLVLKKVANSDVPNYFQGLHMQMNELLEQFVGLIRETCVVVKDAEFPDDGEYVVPHRLVCNLLEIPPDVSRIYIQDRAAFSLAFNCLIPDPDDDPASMAAAHFLDQGSGGGGGGGSGAGGQNYNSSGQFMTTEVKQEPRDGFQGGGGYDLNVVTEIKGEPAKEEKPKIIKKSRKKKKGLIQSGPLDKDTIKKMRRGDMPKACPECDKEFATVSSLKRHVKQNFCVKGPRGRYFFTQQEDAATGKLKYFCTHASCANDSSQFFKSKYSVHTHWENLHKDSVKEYAKCELCPEKFVSLMMLHYHIAKCHKEHGYNLTCPICNLNLRDKERLKEHVRRHTGEKPIACEHCDARFPGKSSLRTHQARKHAVECGMRIKPEKVCEICGKSFKRASHLKAHMSTHSVNPDPKYKCLICNKHLKQSNSYGKHMMNVHKVGERCHLCNKMYATVQALSIHHRDIHGVVFSAGMRAPAGQPGAQQPVQVPQPVQLQQPAQQQVQQVQQQQQQQQQQHGQQQQQQVQVVQPPPPQPPQQMTPQPPPVVHHPQLPIPLLHHHHQVMN